MLLRPYSTTNLTVIAAANCWKLPNISQKMALVPGPCVDQIRSRSKHNRHQASIFHFNQVVPQLAERKFANQQELEVGWDRDNDQPLK